MQDPKVKTDNNGWKYYEKLPDNYCIASMEDFMSKAKRKSAWNI